MVYCPTPTQSGHTPLIHSTTGLCLISCWCFDVYFPWVKRPKISSLTIKVWFIKEPKGKTMIILVFVFVLRYFTCSESDETKKKKTLSPRFFQLLLMEELLWHHSRSGSVDEARTEGQNDCEHPPAHPSSFSSIGLNTLTSQCRSQAFASAPELNILAQLESELDQ